VVGGAEAFEGFALGGGDEVAGGVVGVDDEDGAGAGGDGGFEGVEVDGPAVPVVAGIVKQRVLAEADVVEAGDEVEEGVAGAGDEDVVAGVAEEAEEEAVGRSGAMGAPRSA
jgi:hypothetical protein